MANTPMMIALDLGTTGNRALAFDADGSIRAQAYHEFPQHFPKPGWVEHDPQDIFRSAVQALREVLAQLEPDAPVAIGITNQRETTVLWDRQTGEPVYPAIVWQDRRTEAACRALAAHRAEVKARTGLFIDPYFSATKIAWLLEHVPGLRERSERGGICFGTVDTWMLWNLTGGRSHATEPSNASRTLLFNLKEERFDPFLLDLFRIPDAILPQVLPSDGRFGSTLSELTGRPIPITGMLGDQQAALFAHGGWERGVTKATFGTGIFMLTDTQEQVRHSETLLGTVAYRFENRTHYALEGSIFMGGATLQWLRDQLHFLAKTSDSEALAASVPDNEGVYFVPAMQGLGAPYWDPAARGLLIGLTRKTTPAVITRAALESLAYQTKDVADAMRQSGTEPLTVLRVDGGACANDWLLQFTADLLALPVERPAVIETTALGAAGIAGLAAGFWTKADFLKAKRVGRVFTPQPDSTRILRKNYERWQEAVDRCRGWARQ